MDNRQGEKWKKYDWRKNQGAGKVVVSQRGEMEIVKGLMERPGERIWRSSSPYSIPISPQPFKYTKKDTKISYSGRKEKNCFNSKIHQNVLLVDWFSWVSNLWASEMWLIKHSNRSSSWTCTLRARLNDKKMSLKYIPSLFNNKG